MGRQHRRWMKLLVVMMSLALLAACGGEGGGTQDAGQEPAAAGDTDGAAEPEGAEEAEPDAAEGAAGEAVELRFAWWGTDARHERTEEAIALFEERHPNITVSREFGGFEGYLDRVLTQFAGQNPPDVFQLYSEVMREFVDRDQLLDLATVSPDPLSTDAWPEELLSGGTVDGTLSAMLFGVTTHGIAYNVDMLEEYGVDVPQDGWSWDEMEALAQQVTEASGGAVYGMTDLSTGYQVFEVFLKQRGLEYMDADGLGFGEEDLRDYWEMWEGFRESGAATPPELSAENPTPFDILINGNAAMAFIFANQLGAVRSSIDATVDLTRMPGEQDDQPGAYLRPAMHLGIAASSQHPEEAAMLVDFLLNDPDAAEILGLERGFPGNPDTSDAVTQDLDESETVFADLLDQVRADGAPTPVPPPPGAAEVNALFAEVAEQFAFGQIDVDAAVAQFMERAAAAGF